MSTQNKFEWTDELVKEFMFFKSVFHAPDFDSNVEIFKKYKAGEENFCWAKRIDEQQNTIQKDWEIVEVAYFVETYKKSIIYKADKDPILLKNDKIHSVKRLSDGQVFGVEDETNFGIIEGFYICEEEDSFCYNLMMVCFKGVKANRDISQLKKVKQPLFKTEDGILIRVLDTFAIVELPSYNVSKSFGMEGAMKHENQIYFSTEEMAQNWVLMNKPVLSVNDVYGILNKFENLSAEVLFPNYDIKFKELAKSKIEGK